jgi:hypothetical protein
VGKRCEIQLLNYSIFKNVFFLSLSFYVKLLDLFIVCGFTLMAQLGRNMSEAYYKRLESSPNISIF